MFLNGEERAALPCCLLGGLWAGNAANGSAQRRQAKARELPLRNCCLIEMNVMNEINKAMELAQQGNSQTN